MKNLTNLKEQGILSAKRGFTLVEVVVVIIIAAIIAGFAIPSFMTNMNQAIANAAAYNLSVIYSAELTYHANNGQYCLDNTGASPACQASTGGDSHCADTLAAINCNLGLNITDSNNSYIVWPALDGLNGANPNPNDPACLAFRNPVGSPLEILYTWKLDGVNGQIQCNEQLGCGGVNLPCLTDLQYCPTSVPTKTWLPNGTNYIT
jgi:prepilin-type N-terminal cleavage/methylation domain-containing protein